MSRFHLIVICVLQCLVAVVLNKVSAVLAMIGLALYSWDLMNFEFTVVHQYEHMNYDVKVIILSFI